MFVSICGPCSRRQNCACLVDYNAQISIGNGQKVLHQYEIRHMAFETWLLASRLSPETSQEARTPLQTKDF